MAAFTTQGLLEMSINRAATNAVESLQLARSAEVIALDPQVQATQWQDKRDEDRYGR